MATIILGRDGMGEHADEADFDAYVDYVSERIDGMCGFEVDVDLQPERGAQDTVISAHGPGQEQAIRDALYRLWDAFCADDSAWPKRSEINAPHP